MSRSEPPQDARGQARVHSALVVVPMVQIGHVGMGMHLLSVCVDRTVPSHRAVCVQMSVMRVRVVVSVFVRRHGVLVGVFVGRSERQRNAERGDCHRHELDRVDRVRQEHPRQHRADEGRGGEDHLPAAAPSCCAPRTHNVIDAP